MSCTLNSTYNPLVTGSLQDYLLQDYKITRLQDYKITRLQDYIMKYRRFEDIPVWQQARQFLNRIYGICGKEKFKNNYELLDQVRRAGISIMLNIAEGFERKTNKEFARFINIAKASAGEIRCGLYIALDLKYISIGEFNELFSEITSIGNQLSRFEIYLLETHKK